MAFVTLEDLSGFVEVVVFSDVYMAAAELLKGEEPILVTGILEISEDTAKLRVSAIASLQEVKERLTSKVHFRLTTPGLEAGQLQSLKSLMGRYRGNCEAIFHVVVPNRSETILRLPGEQLKVAASDEILAEAHKLFGYDVVTFE